MGNAPIPNWSVGKFGSLSTCLGAFLSTSKQLIKSDLAHYFVDIDTTYPTSKDIDCVADLVAKCTIVISADLPVGGLPSPLAFLAQELLDYVGHCPVHRIVRLVLLWPCNHS